MFKDFESLEFDYAIEAASTAAVVKLQGLKVLKHGQGMQEIALFKRLFLGIRFEDKGSEGEGDCLLGEGVRLTLMFAALPSRRAKGLDPSTNPSGLSAGAMRFDSKFRMGTLLLQRLAGGVTMAW
jgi:hypothetical protein